MALVSSTELTADQSEKLQLLIDALPTILTELDKPTYDEIFGHRIGIEGTPYVEVAIRNEILLKFLVASEYDLALAKEKLVLTMNWRGKFNVLSAAYVEDFDAELEKMGIVTEFPGNKDNFRVVTWNFYNNVKLTKSWFVGFKAEEAAGTQQEPNGSPGLQFLRWRIGLMERSLALLEFSDSDNTKMAQVHDYKGASIFRIDSDMKAATKEIIKLFSDHYPELLSKKFFINVPLIMGWVFGFFRAMGIISASTLKRFEVMHHGDVSGLFGEDNLPAVYNGGLENRKVPDIFSKTVKKEAIALPTYAKVLLQQQGKIEGAAV
ncbi:hypothetical protein PUMCH_000746 [Australozyma saopauloensis]|uniref:Phosphatidylinositol transfer protein SFH5 n=1 Tax=Australozyma saopauloensis TaxID=291208 RepID=A0AAX4H6W7_9ASCO|nr:hypothetical protein PUMCH_000746 [[Candida] saopauloensis]